MKRVCSFAMCVMASSLPALTTAGSARGEDPARPMSAMSSETASCLSILRTCFGSNDQSRGGGDVFWAGPRFT